MTRRFAVATFTVLALAGCTIPRSHPAHHHGGDVHVEICPPYCGGAS